MSAFSAGDARQTEEIALIAILRKTLPRFLGVPAVFQGSISRRRRTSWIDAGDTRQVHVFFDPDTGISLNDAPDNKYLTIADLVARARARPNKLTLVYDQSINYDPQRGGGNAIEQFREKLRRLRRRGIHGFVYQSQTNFFLVSTNTWVLFNVKYLLLELSKLPEDRLVEI